jgi:MFS family permease
MNNTHQVTLHQVSNFCSALGNSIVVMTIPWLILERTDSPSFAGLVAAVSALPAVFVSPIGGWLADRIGRRAVSIGADLFSALSVAAFPTAALTIGLTESTILLIAVAGALFDPAGYTARKTMLPDVAKASKINLDRLNGIHEGFMGIAWIFGPAAGAVLISTVGSVNAFWVASGLFMAAALAIAFLRIGDSGKDFRRRAAASGAKENTGLLVGLTTLWSDRLMRTLSIALLILAAIYLPTESVVLPTYFERIDSPGGLGLVVSSIAAGGAVGAFVYGWISARMQRRTLVRLILLGSAGSVLAMALLPPLPILMVAGLFLGLSWGPFPPLMSSLIQQRVKPELHGRVFGVHASVFYAAPPLGMLLTGLSVESYGVNTTYLILGGILAVTASLVLLAKPLREKF